MNRDLSNWLRLTCICFLCLTTRWAAGQSNIVLNGSFEVNAYEWWGFGGGGVEIGQQSAQGNNHLILRSYLYQDLTTVPGRNYVIKFATKTALPRVLWAGEELTNFVALPGTNFQWHYLFYSHVTATGEVTRLEFDDLSGGTYIDDISVGWLEEPVQVLQQPASAGGFTGSSATFTVSAFGGPPIFYQWFHDGEALAGQTNFYLQLNDLKPKDAGIYFVVVSNVSNSLISSNAQLTVEAPPAAPTIVLQPESQVLAAGYGYSMRVAAIGAAPLTYQWKVNGTNIPGGTNSSLSFELATNTDGATYTVLVANSVASVTSLPATLIVTNRTGGGIFIFNNRTVNLPIYDVDGLTKLTGSNYIAQLYAGPSPTILRPILDAKPFRTGILAGFNNQWTIFMPDVAPNQTAYVQLRAWEAEWGSSYEEARGRGGKYGFSSVTPVTTVGLPTLPPAMATPSFNLRSGNALFTTGKLQRGDRLPSGEYQWILTGSAGARYLVEKRMPPNNWFPLLTVTNMTGTATFTDPGNASAAFYRARILD